MKVVFNACYGEFELSEKAIKMFNKLKGTNYKYNIEIEEEVSRADETLVKVVEYLKQEANGEYANLAIAEVPDDSYWDIDEYDGTETVTYSFEPKPKEYYAKVIEIYEQEEEE